MANKTLNPIQSSSLLVQSLGRLLGRIGLYPMEHPAVQRALREVHEGITDFLLERPEVMIGIADGKLLVEGEVVEGVDLAAREVAGTLEHFGVGSVTFRRGIPQGELEIFGRALADRKSELAGFLADQGVLHIQMNLAQYTRVEDGESVRRIPSGGGPAASGDGSGEASSPWIQDLPGMGLETMIWEVIQRAVPDPEDRRRVFEIIAGQLRNDLEKKVAEATRSLVEEKQRITHESARTESVLTHAADGVVMVDETGRVLVMNPAAERLFGMKRKDGTGKDLLSQIGEEHMVALSRDLSSRLEDDRGAEIEVRGEDETRRILRASTALVHNPDGKVVGMISVLSDVTRQKELDRLKQDFVSHVTHELRTPLVAIRQTISLILEKTAGAINDRQEKMLGIAKRNIDRLNRLINDLLDIQKIEAGKMPIHPDAEEIAPIVDDVIHALSPWATHREIAVGGEVAPGVPRVRVDRDRIHQVLTNLVSNGIKFTGPGGKVTIRVSPPIQNPGTPGSFLKVSVGDTGRGIAREDLGKIFEKFQQVGGRESTDVKGSGLGLSIVKALVEGHGGAIRVESEPGVGSKFTFTLPVDTGESPEETIRSVPEPDETKQTFWRRLFRRSQTHR
ncbi:MAG: PAS domain-containing protein, partial [Nitrospirae bacterium]|nr:PAS domain-containing protein [Nitrospirota bacterium]